jgi:hypothetical protein
MSETFRIIQSVAQLWHDGPVLFGAEWPMVKEQLLLKLEQLDSQPNEEEVAIEGLLAVFDKYPGARERLVNLLGAGPAMDKGEYKPLPGAPTAIGASQFTCPEQGCGYTWTRRVLGQRMEKCPQHHLPLVHVPEVS